MNDFRAGITIELKGKLGAALGTTKNRSLNKWVVSINGTSHYRCRIYKNGTEIKTRATSYAARNLNLTGSNASGSNYSLPP